jgi:hypothetical protein
LPPDFVVFVTILVLSNQFGMRYVLTYCLTDEDVRAVLFVVAPVSVMRYEFIEGVKTISALEALFRVAWRAQSKVVGRAVMIRGRGFFPVLITPDAAEGFAREVRRRANKQTGQLPLGWSGHPL